MKTEKFYILMVILLAVLLLPSGTVSAQQNGEGAKHITIITKTTDENGVTTTKKVDKVSDEADDIDWNEVINTDLQGNDVEITIENEGTAPETLFRFHSPGQEKGVFHLNMTDCEGAFLGVYINTSDDASAAVTDIVEGTGAEKAGIQSGDVITAIDQDNVSSYEGLVNVLKKHKAGDVVKVGLTREGKTEVLTATLTQRKCPDVPKLKEFEMEGLKELKELKGWNGDNFKLLDQAENPQPKLGVQIENTEDNTGTKITEVTNASAAQEAGLKAGDVIYKIDDMETNTIDELIDAVQSHEIGDKVTVYYKRDGKNEKVNATLKKGFALRLMNGDAFGNWNVPKRTVIIKKSNDEVTPTPPSTDVAESAERQGDQEMELYPNPSNGAFKVNFRSAVNAPIKIKILDVNGKEVYSEEVNDFTGMYTKDIQLTNQAEGSYILNIIQGDKVMTEKLVFHK